jgi:hypothetical protein
LEFLISKHRILHSFFQNPDLLRKLVDSEPTHSTQKHSKAGGGLENHPPTRKRYFSSLSTIEFASMMIQTPFQIERFWNLPGNIIM